MHNYIVIEGPLGVGKTTLAKMLAEKLNGETLMEDADENPFLTQFYRDPKKYGFQTQIFFLLRRYQRAVDIAQIDLFKRIIVSDYLFEKDRIFARNNLSDDEFWLYDQLFGLLSKRLVPPDLVIFLQATTDVLLERIRKRNRKYERAISAKYLEEINRSFNDFFFHYSRSPLLVINASQIDFVQVPEDFEDLVERIGRMKAGTQYYVPMSSKQGKN
jgi:deoxyadenosine/deoxycytidine kinase